MFLTFSILDPMSPENVTMLPEWLPYMTSTADGWLLDSNGSPYKLAHTSLSVGTAQLGDILRWEWIRPGVLNFIPTCGISVFSRPSIRALERLCATLVSNFPHLLYRPQQTNVLRLYNGQRHYNHEWHLHTSEATLTHIDTTLVKATHTVHSAMDCDIMATRDLNRQKVSFHAHPRFTRIVQLWGGNGRYNTTRSLYRQQVAATRTQIGKDTRDAAVNKAVQTAGSLWPGLQLIQWSELRNIPGITVYTEKADLSCSNPECSQVVQSSVQHLFWERPKAKLVWNYFYALWAKIGITPGHDPAIWIFSLDLPHTPKHAWTTIKRHIIGHKFSNEHLQDHLYSVAHMLWRYRSASLIQTIWCAHLRRMDSDPIESTADMAIMMTRLEAGMRNLTRLAEAQAGDSDGHTVAAVLKAYVDCFLSQTDAIPLTPSDTRGVYLLFFDGGSRGNPGPGGTGSIIVRVHKDSHTASLIWAASMAYSRKDTTNNFAEYWGLIHGLREAQRSHFEPLYVIGDSALIISQQRMHRSPRQHRLARLYKTSRRLADCIDIRGWYHHYRAFNKMADSAANLAIDTRTSTQVHFPTQRAAFNNLTQGLDNDVMHWLMRSSEDPRSLDNTRQPHIGPRKHAILETVDNELLLAVIFAGIFVQVTEQYRVVGAWDFVALSLGSLALKAVIKELTKTGVVKLNVKDVRSIFVTAGLPTVLIDTQVHPPQRGCVEPSRCGSTPDRSAIVPSTRRTNRPDQLRAVEATDPSFQIAESYASMTAEYIAIGCSMSIVFFYWNHPKYELSRLRGSPVTDDSSSSSTELAAPRDHARALVLQIVVELCVDYFACVLETGSGIESHLIQRHRRFLGLLFMSIATLNTLISAMLYIPAK
ncbi:reverse transcriptase, partial [Globisporangium splendens]